MKKILFKIKKIFLILISLIFNLIFNRKSESSVNEDKEQSRFKVNKHTVGKYDSHDRYESKDNHIKSKFNNYEKKYPTIRVNIEKIYSIEKRIDKIILQIENEDNINALNSLCDELKKYKDKMEYLETKITKERTNKDEYNQFMDISKSIKDKARETVDIVEQKVNYLQIEKEKQELLQKNQENTVEKAENNNNDLEENNTNLDNINDNLKKIEDIIIIKEFDENSIKLEKACSDLKKDEKKVKEKKETKRKVDKLKKDDKKAAVDIKNENKIEDVEKDKKKTLENNIDIGVYQLQINSISNIIKTIDITRRKENIKKITSNTLGALVLMATIPPIVMMNNKGVKDLLLLNNLVRKSRNIIGKKKQKKLTYEEVINKVIDSNLQTHINLILADTMSQINSLREELRSYGNTEEIQQLLAQLDEIELELIEKISQVNENTDDYSNENRRTR